MQIHVVKKGETAYSISNLYHVNLSLLLGDNGLTEDSKLVVGQALVIQFPRKTHLVQSGDTLSAIALKNNISLDELYRNNYSLFGNPNITPGQILVIEYEQKKLGTFEANSYAYPYIKDELMKKQLPYLTYLAPFTYGIQADGSLVDLNDEQLIKLSNMYGTKKLMHLSTLTESGNFSNDRAHLVLTNPEIQTVLIDAIIANMKAKGYDGLDVDFEFIFPEDRYGYATFLQNLRLRLNPLGYPVYSALAPKTHDNQRGILYEGHDYSLIGAATNKVLLMTYEWGYTYGPPMAVAPLNNVRDVVEYAVTRISSSKMLLGIPTYGYDWTLPFVPGGNGAPSISPVEALDLARKYNAEIEFDEIAMAPWFKYSDENGVLHEVWFEDARSIKAKLKLAHDFGFFGIGYWNSMRDFPQNWVVLNALYNIG
ncbi:MAG: glycosyl hydrolase family 18 protein [Oscillospiraceae bacterium]